MAKYRLAGGPGAMPGSVIRDDGASIPPAPGNCDWAEFQQWLAQGNVPDPYVPPSPPADDARLDTIAADPDSVEIVEMLRTATLSQIKAYINNNVTNVASAKVALVKMALLLALIIKGRV